MKHSPEAPGSLAHSEDTLFRKYFVESHILSFANFGEWDGKKVLEIGCGIGTDTLMFADAGAEVTAVDLSETSLDLAKRRSHLYKFDTKFVKANAEHLSDYLDPSDAGTFDLIYCFGMLHHTQNPGAVLDEIKKFAGPQTQIRLMVYNRWSWKALGIFLKHGWGQIARYSEANIGCPVTHTYSRSGIRELLEQHGFKVQNVTIEHIFPYRVRPYRQYHYEKTWLFSMLPYRAFRFLERHLGWHLLIDACL